MLKGIDTNLLQKHAVSKTSSSFWDNSRHQLPALRKGKPLPIAFIPYIHVKHV